MARHYWPGQWLHGHTLSRPAEVQLKPKHQPYKLGRQWPELLLRFTDASDDDVAMGQWHLKGALGRVGGEGPRTEMYCVLSGQQPPFRRA